MLDLSNNTLSELPSTIGKLKLLRYLDLSKTEIRELPNSICNLYNLQTLKLLGCLWLFNLPKDLGKLINLRYLELDEMFWFKCSTQPPKIGNLTRLRNWHAFLVGRKSGYGIEELKNMVYLTGSLHISKLENAVNAGDAKLNEKERVDKLVLEWSSRDVNPQDVSDQETKLLEDLQPHSNLKELHIFNYMGNNFPNWITGGLLQNLHTLTLDGCSGCRTLALAQIRHLRILNIKRMQELEKWSDETCMFLHRLKISCCERLSELPKYFLFLRNMNIKKCCSLKSLPKTPSLLFLMLYDNPVLEDLNEEQGFIQSGGPANVLGAPFLNLTEMEDPNEMQGGDTIQSDEGPSPVLIAALLKQLEMEDLIEEPVFKAALLKHLEMKGLIEEQGEDTIQSDEGPSPVLIAALLKLLEMKGPAPVYISSFSNLLEMKVINCPKLQVLPDRFDPQKLEIRGCEGLSALTDLNQRLQYLVLDKCCDGTLVRAVPDTSSLKSLVISNISNLTTLPRWPKLPGLRALYITRCNDLVSLSGEGSLMSLSSLELLSIRGCSKLENLPHEGLPTALSCLIIASCSSLKSLGTNGTLKILNSLKDLYIEDCPLLQSFPGDGLPASLQHLCIQDCPSLTQQCGTEDVKGPEWPKISHIPDLEIDFIRREHPSKAAWCLSFCYRAGFDISDTR